MSEHGSDVDGVVCGKCGLAAWEQFDNVCPGKPAGLDFGQALAAMKAGKRVRRAGWVNKHWWWRFDVDQQDFAEGCGRQDARRHQSIDVEKILANDWELVP